MKFLNHNFTLLDDKKDRFLLIGICFVFSIFFVNLFVPFNINRWVDDSGFIQFMRLSSYGLVVALVFLVSQFPLRKLLGIQKFKMKTYILWLTGEIILKSIEGQLSGYTFKRCHRSFLINLRNLEFTQKNSKRLQLKMKGVDTFIPVSQKYSSLFTDFLSR